jgi:hypothetical protein
MKMILAIQETTSKAIAPCLDTCQICLCVSIRATSKNNALERINLAVQ